MSVLHAQSNACFRRLAKQHQQVRSRLQSLQPDETQQRLASAHCHAARPESSCSSCERPASPSVHSRFASCGSRPALQQSSLHQETCTPSPALQTSLEVTEQLRVGAAASHPSAYARPVSDVSSGREDCGFSAVRSRKVHTGLMSFRATWACVLTAILLLVSSAASSCGAQCSLDQLQPACHSQGANPQAHQARMGSPICHSMGRAQTGSAPNAAVSWSSPCSHNICAQQPARVTDQRSALARVPILSRFAHADGQYFEPVPLVRTVSHRGPPQAYLPSTPVDLHIIQRV